MTGQPGRPPEPTAAAPRRLSVPRRITAPPRELTREQQDVLLAVADLLIPDAGGNPKASAVPGYPAWLQRALAARADSLDVLAGALDLLASARRDDLDGQLRAWHGAGDARFHLLSSVTAGAYLMAPEVRARIGYPGQHPDPPRIDEAADELSDGILDPVLARGPIYVSAAGE
jgi:hypothetical protein